MTTLTREQVRAAAARPRGNFCVMSIPGNADDGSDSAWTVADRGAGRYVAVFGGYEAARDEARQLNRGGK